MPYLDIPANTNGVTPRARRRSSLNEPDPSLVQHVSDDELRSLLKEDPTAVERREAVPLPASSDASRDDPALEGKFNRAFAANYEPPVDDEPEAVYFESAPLEPIEDPTKPPHMGALPAPSGVPTTPGDPVVPDDGTDPRPLSRREAMQREHDDLSNVRPKDRNGRVKSALLGALSGMSKQAQAVTEGAARSGRPVDMYGLMSVIGAGGGSAVAGAANPSLDENQKRLKRMDDLTVKIKGALAQEKQAVEIAHTSAQTEKAKADAAYTRNTKPKETEARLLRQKQQVVLSKLRLYKGQQLDVNNATHAALLQSAADAGVEVDPQSWNDAASNFAFAEIVDPERPEQKRRVRVNKATGEVLDIARSGYVQPVGADGMTEAQRRGDADRDSSRADTNARFEKMFGLGVDRFEESVRRGLSADAARDFGIETRGHFERGRAIEKEIADLERRKSENLIRKGEADERIGALRGEATQLGEQVEAARSKALGAPSANGIRSRARGSAPAAPPAASPASSSGSGIRPRPQRAAPAPVARRPAAAPASAAPAVDEGAIRAKAIELGLDPDTAVQRARSRRMLK